MNIPNLKNNLCTLKQKAKKSTSKESNILLIFQCNNIEEIKLYSQTALWDAKCVLRDEIEGNSEYKLQHLE